MKKLALVLMTFVVCVCSASATTFVPSQSGGGAPNIENTVVGGQEIAGEIFDENENTIEIILPENIYSGSLEDANDPNSSLSEAEKQALKDLYNQFQNGEIKLSEVLPTLNELVGSQFGEQNNADNLVVKDLFHVGLTNDSNINNLQTLGNKTRLTFKTNIEKGTFLQVAYFANGEWKLAEDVEINDDGTVSATFEHLGQIAFLVPGEMAEAVKPFNWLPYVIAMALIVGGYVYSKKNKKA